MARAYDLALAAICRGDLARGRTLVERAIEVEDRAWRGLTDRIEVGDLQRGDAWDLDWLASVAQQTPQAGACGEPAELRGLIDDLCGVRDSMPDPPNREKTAAPWWTEEEEEEDEGVPGDPS